MKLLNHDLTQDQLNELKNDFNVDEIVQWWIFKKSKNPWQNHLIDV